MSHRLYPWIEFASWMAGTGSAVFTYMMLVGKI